MLTASWPHPPPRVGRAAASPHVRRRVDEAERRAIRLALLLGAPIVVLLLAADAAQSLLRLGEAGRLMALVQLAMMTLITALVYVLRDAGRRPEPLALTVLIAMFAAALAHLMLMPEMTPLSTANLATILVASGLFLPWKPTWHLRWLATAEIMTLAFVVLPIEARSLQERILVAAAVAVAGLASLVGQRLWHVRMRRMLEQQFELRWLSRHAQRQEARVRELNRELNRVARIDTLTGLGNRLALDDALNRLGTEPLAAVLFDVDHFKRFNDRCGHLTGDTALSRVGAQLRAAIRGDDLAFRYGGEEFLLLLPGASAQHAAGVAERVRTALEQDEVASAWGLTLSGGVSVSDPADRGDPTPLLRRADEALYAAKRGGRNRIAVAAGVGGEPMERLTAVR